jgi:hypothetical protein
VPLTDEKFASSMAAEVLMQAHCSQYFSHAIPSGEFSKGWAGK